MTDQNADAKATLTDALEEITGWLPSNRLEQLEPFVETIRAFIERATSAPELNGKYKDDALYKLLLNGKATEDDQHHAADWIKRLHRAAPAQEPVGKYHSIERTSPKGEPFIGTCRLCGTSGLKTADIYSPCGNQRGLSENAALLEAIAPPPDAALAALKEGK
jgi:hypothetical protein